MSWFSRQTFATHVVISLVAGFLVGVSAEVLADTVYKWTTEDGVVSYTDDQKHIPSRYRDQVETRPMQRLDGYDRYTPLGKQPGMPETAPAHVAAARGSETIIVEGGGAGMSVMTGGTRYGQGGMIVPVDAAPTTTASSEPVVIENRRVKRSDSMATSHETVVRQGDRIISIDRDEPSQRETGMVPPLDPPL